jgi:hypothetical protein
MRPKLLALALLGAACSHHANQAESEPAPERNEKTTVKVQNQNFQDMNVYVLAASQRVRLGMVGGLSTQVFEIPRDIVMISAQLRFEVHPIGGRRNPISETITVMPGDQVQLTIPPRYP